MKRTALITATALAAVLAIGGGLALAQQAGPWGPGAGAEAGFQRQGRQQAESRGPRADEERRAMQQQARREAQQQDRRATQRQDQRATRQQGQRAGQMLDQIDADGDGRLSLAEVLDWREAVFFAMDADSDGAVSEAEYQAVRFGPGAIEGAQGPRAAAMQARKAEAFKAMDTAGTGAVPFEAFMAEAAALFARADADGNGYLDPTERQDSAR